MIFLFGQIATFSLVSRWSHLNNFAKRLSRCVVTCTQAYANVRGKQSTFVSVMIFCVCVWFGAIMLRRAFSGSIPPFSWIFSGFELQPCAHLVRHATRCTIGDTQIHTEALPRLLMSSNPPSSNCTAPLHKTLSLDLFMSAGVWTHEAGLEPKTSSQLVCYQSFTTEPKPCGKRAVICSEPYGPALIKALMPGTVSAIIWANGATT